MTAKEKVLQRERERGRAAAQALQDNSANMSGTELNAADDRIPRFAEAVKRKNMLDRKAGQTDGFVCRSTAGRVVRLIQSYDSDVYTAEPEELSAQWRFVWSTDPAKAQPFIALSTSPYGVGECCLNRAGVACRSKIVGNVWPPDDYPDGWEVGV